MSSQGDDYNPREAITKLSASLEQPDKFAEIFCTAAKKQKDIDSVLKENIRDIIRSDNETRGQIKALLREVEKEDLEFYFKKFGYAVTAVFSAVIGSAVTVAVGHFFK